MNDILLLMNLILKILFSRLDEDIIVIFFMSMSSLKLHPIAALLLSINRLTDSLS